MYIKYVCVAAETFNTAIFGNLDNTYLHNMFMEWWNTAPVGLSSFE